ncbi:NAD-dependent epimerase [Sporichthya brevicatena]|uniref:NAD-dependent epimerase n=1 Tax=Sporichthya brevicatena TaxID=171442 RepID=A0ABN1GY76_9ACTN
MAVVVTGSAGFLGQAVVARLLAAGREVIGIDRRGGVPTGPGHTELHADLIGSDGVAADAIREAGGVIHLAGCPGVRDSRTDVAWHRHRDNVLATAAVLGAAPRRTTVVVATSSSIYGGSVGGRPCAETDPLNPRGGYAASKALAEALCRDHNEAGGRVVVARPFTVAGEGQRSDMALSMWIDAARAGRPLRILGGPERTRDVTDVRDAARALIALLDAGEPGPVNVGTGVPIRLDAMIDAIATALDVDVRTRVEPAGPEEVSDTRADTRRLERIVGFVPHTDLADVVARQIAAADFEQVAESGRVPA